MAFSRVLALRVGVLWHWHLGGRGEPGVPPVLFEVNDTPIFHSYGPKWLSAGYVHWGWVSCDTHAWGEFGVPPCLVQVNDTPIFHSYGPKWLLAGYWHWGWVSCDTGTLGGRGEPGVPLSCLSQRYSNLSLLWSEMAFSRVLALRVGILWHWHAGGEFGVPPVLSKSTILQSFTLMVRNGF